MADPRPRGPSRPSSPTVRCPNCGLTQLRRPSCKSCGTVLAPHAPGSSAPSSSVPTIVPAGPDKSNQQRRRLLWAGICAIILIILITGAFYLRASLQAKAERERIATQEKAEHQAASEAIQALKSLQSITTAGVSYQNYAPRVLDVKIKVDQYLASRPKKPQVPQVHLDIEGAMAVYVYAARIWNADIVQHYRETWEISRRAEVLCPELVLALDQAATRLNVPRQEMPIPPSLLWGCATRHITEAEKHNQG